jgi:hypothetical protein
MSTGSSHAQSIPVSGTAASELSLRPPSAAGFPGTLAFKVLHDWDDAPLTIVGVSIFLKLGLAVNGFFHDDDGTKSVTAFAKGRWDEWPPKEK